MLDKSECTAGDFINGTNHPHFYRQWYLLDCQQTQSHIVCMEFNNPLTLVGDLLTPVLLTTEYKWTIFTIRTSF